MKRRKPISKPSKTDAISLRKKRSQGPIETEVPKEPRTIVIAHGIRNSRIKQLKQDLRKVFFPNTALNVKERKFNRIRDFLDVCGPLAIHHMMALFLTDAGMNLKIMKVPQGPTLSFRVESYTLMRSVQTATRKPFDVKNGAKSGPFVVMTNFQKSKHHELLVTLIQNMFPSIDPDSVDLKDKTRVVLFDYDEKHDQIRFRHYRFIIPVSGLNKAVKDLVYGNVPDLGDVAKISEFLSKSGFTSESEGEDTFESYIHLDSGNKESSKRRVKLVEIGPRMDLSLHKIEQGIMDGWVLYNKFVEKSPEEIAENARRREQSAQLKNMRRKEQERRVERKRKEREIQNQIQKNQIPRETISDDDDIQYYREEVGIEPDSHFGVQGKTKKRRKKQEKQ